MNITAIRDELGAALETIGGLRAFGYWPNRIVPPAAIVAWPDPYTFNNAYQRGASSAAIDVTVLVGKPDARSSQLALARYADEAGAQSVRNAIEAHASTAWDVATVTTWTGATVQISDVEYLAAVFTVQIFGQGG